MLLTLTTTRRPATDLGYILNKSPFRCQAAELSFGTAYVFFPEAGEERCTAALLVDMDPIKRVRGRISHGSDAPLEPYVNDRSYVCSSFLSVALARVFGQTMNGKCGKRPDLVDTAMPLECALSVLPCRGGEGLLRGLFEPLGYRVEAARHPLDERFPAWGESPYYAVNLSKVTTVRELFNHLYVLVPVLDNQKHYYIDEPEIEKLLRRGEGWLAAHPEKEQIARRYLKYKPSYAREALERLADEHADPRMEEESAPLDEGEKSLEHRLNLNEERLGTILAILKGAGVRSVADLGCGEGKLLQVLLKDRQFENILGMDVSIRTLETAAERLRIRDLPDLQARRIRLIQGSLMYRDSRLEGFAAAVVAEVVEHLDAPRLAAFERTIFDCARPGLIILTTPNREYNEIWTTLKPGTLRHRDHRFEWTREELAAWAARIAGAYGYVVRHLSAGPIHERLGAPTQIAVFAKSITAEGVATP